MIRAARIVSIFGNAENGKYGAKRVNLLFEGKRYEVKAYAKKLKDLDFLVELLAAKLGIEIGLPIPEPVIAYLPDKDEIWFASVDVKFPDLSHRLEFLDNDHLADTTENIEILSKLANWQLIYDAISFDEWIANSDRNSGNVLYDGTDQFYLIDHNLAMRLPFSPDAPINNQLLNTKLFFTQDEVGRQRIRNKISALVDSIDESLPRTITSRILESANDLNEKTLNNIVDFLEKRLHHLTAITHNKIPTKQMTL